MTVFLILVFGTLITIVFAQIGGARKVGTRHETDLRALQARVDALEASSGPAPATVATASLAPAAVVAPPAVVERETPPQPPEREYVAAPKCPPSPGLGERLGTQLRTGWDQWIAQNLLAAAGGVFVLLGASFFVAVAISNGWLTPWRQVAAAVVGGALLLVAGWRVWRTGVVRRAADILAQSLVGTGAGVMLVGVVAGARIYEHPLYPTWVGLIGAGAIAAIVVATSVLWRAQVTAALGIATAIAAPLLVDAPMTTGSITFLLLALAASGVVIALRGWPWLLQISIIGSLVQAGAWANDDNGEHHGALLVVAVLVAWWALQALPALYFELRAERTRLRMPTSSVLFLLAGLAVLFGRIAFDSVHASGFEALLCVLAALHFIAGAVMLRVRPSSQAGAVFVWAIAAALAAAAAAVLLGGAAQPAFWAVETLAMLWLYVRFSDKQAGITAAALAVLTAGWSLYLAQPTALAHPLDELATGVLALAAVVVMLGGAAYLVRRVAALAIALAAAAWVALYYLAGVLIVGLVAPAGAVDQTGQLFVSGAWAVLATSAVLAALVLPRRFRSGIRIGAELSLWTVAAKLLLIDSLALGVHEPRLLWLLAALAGLAAVLVLCESRLPAGRLPLPLATPFAAVLVISGVTQPGLDAYRAGTPHLLETLVVLALSALVSLLALWRYPAARSADALAVGVALVAEAVALATVTLVTPHLGHTSEVAQRAVSAGPLLLALGLLGAAVLAVRLPAALRRRALECSGALLALASVLTVADTAVFGVTGRAVVFAGAWLVAAVACSLALRLQPAQRLLQLAAAGAVAMCAFALVTTANPRAIAYGAPHGSWVLAAALMAALAAVAAAFCAPARWRTGTVAAALAVALYGVSVLVVTALTQDSQHLDQFAQLSLSVVWTVWGVAMLGAGVVRRSSLGLFLRRGGIALTGVAAAKVLIVDTAHFDTAHRAGVFLALGLILLAGAAAYARLTKKLDVCAV